jgi:hypothetical protein
VERVVAHGEALPAFDMHCPMLSLPGAVGTDMATIPAAAGYLRAGMDAAAAWRERLAALGPGLRVGVAWAGNPAIAADRRRSMAPERLAPVLATRGVRFFSLQKSGPAGSGMTDFMAEMEDFSVDTAVAHLAAALGREVWLMDRFDADWRWFSGRRDSPWYPTLRVFRQGRAGDWEAVVAEVARDLIKHRERLGLRP